MTKKKLKALCLLLVVILLVGCGGNASEEESEAQSVQTDESREESELVVESEGSETIEDDEAAAYQITSIIPETVSENQYHWVILQSGRNNVNQRNVDQINELLKENGLSSSIVFHIVETTEYITPDVLEKVSEHLE